MRAFFSLTKQELIGGIEINETTARFVLVFFNRGSSKYNILHRAEESIPKGVINDGAIADEAIVTSIIRAIIKKIPLFVPYVVLSIPPHTVYSKIFTFPSSLDRRHLNEAIQIAVDLQLPFAQDEYYIDWEEVKCVGLAGFLVAAGKKSVIDQYISCSVKAGVKPIALEFHPVSLLRAVSVPSETATLITLENVSDTTAFVVNGQTLRFTQVFPYMRIAKKNIENELVKLRNFYETGYGKIGNTVSLRDLRLTNEWDTENMASKNIYQWFTVLGAGKRAALPRGNDTALSLMAIGTREAFRYQQALSFTRVLSNVTIGIAIFFITIFLGAWIFLYSLSKSMLSKTVADVTLLFPSKLAEPEEEVKQFTKLLATTNGFVQKMPRWSLVLSMLRAQVKDTITVTSLTLTDQDNIATLTGVAKSRMDLNEIKKRLEDMEFVRDAALPLTNLDLKENIPFTITFRFTKESVYTY